MQVVGFMKHPVISHQNEPLTDSVSCDFKEFLNISNNALPCFYNVWWNFLCL